MKKINSLIKPKSKYSFDYEETLKKYNLVRPSLTEGMARIMDIGGTIKYRK